MRGRGQPYFCCVLMENVRDVGELAATPTKKPDLVSAKPGSNGEYDGSRERETLREGKG